MARLDPDLNPERRTPVKRGSKKGTGIGRPPVTGNDKQTTYMVAVGFIICDFDGVRRNGGAVQGEGDAIELTAKQAKYYQKMGAISVYIADEADEDEPTDTKEKDAGTKVDRGGKPLVGNAPRSSAAQKAPGT